MGKAYEFKRLWEDHHAACVAENGELLLQTQERIMIFVEKNHARIFKALRFSEHFEQIPLDKAHEIGRRLQARGEVDPQDMPIGVGVSVASVVFAVLHGE